MEQTYKKNRVLAIDLARGASILMVPIIHTLWMYGKADIQAGTYLGEIVHFIGKGTPMFLIAMGFSFILSRNQHFGLAIKRGFMLLGAGFLMNFFKFVFPILAGFMPDEFVQAYGWTVPATTDNLIYLLLTGDILQLAGVALLLMAVIHHFIKNKYAILGISLVMMLTTNMVRGIRVDIAGVDYVLDLLWGAEFNVYFAVFPWAAFIFMGMFFGKIYQESEGSTFETFKAMFIYGVGFLVLGAGLCLYDFEYNFGDYFHLGPGGAIYLAGFNFLLFCIGHLFVKYLPNNNLFFDLLVYVSKHVTSIYFIQWVIICWGMGIFGFQQLEEVEVLMLMPVTMGATLFLQLGIDRLSGKKKKQVVKEEEKPSVQKQVMETV